MKKSQDIEYTGTLPVTLTAIDSYLDSYEITGNMEQASTPTQTNPVIPQECGELVASGEHAGEYAIPITSGNTTTNIYLAEPLRKIDEYADTVDSTGTVTRAIYKKVFDGTENFAVSGSGNTKFFRTTFSTNPHRDGTICLCSHYIYRSITTSNDVIGVRTYTSSGDSTLRVRPENVSTMSVDDFKSWLAAQYANGTPVIVWYVLETSVTETITAPQIPVSGETTIDYDGTLAPLQVDLAVYGWVDAPYKLNTDILTAFPATFKGDGSAISDWTISGNCYQASTPTPDNPVAVDECGELVETGEHAGEYAVPIVLNGVTTTIYLSEPLRRIGEYADTVDSDGGVTRRIYKLVLTGEETFSQITDYPNVIGFLLYDRLTHPFLAASPTISTHYVDGGKKPWSEAQVDEITQSSGYYILWMDKTIYDTTEKFKTWLATQYNNGTPVTIYYVLDSSTSEQITSVTLTTVSGSNTLDFGTTLKPARFEGVDVQWAERKEKKRVNGEWV